MSNVVADAFNTQVQDEYPLIEPIVRESVNFTLTKWSGDFNIACAENKNMAEDQTINKDVCKQCFQARPGHVKIADSVNTFLESHIIKVDNPNTTSFVFRNHIIQMYYAFTVNRPDYRPPKIKIAQLMNEWFKKENLQKKYKSDVHMLWQKIDISPVSKFKLNHFPNEQLQKCFFFRGDQLNLTPGNFELTTVQFLDNYKETYYNLLVKANNYKVVAMENRLKKNAQSRTVDSSEIGEVKVQIQELKLLLNELQSSSTFHEEQTFNLSGTVSTMENTVNSMIQEVSRLGGAVENLENIINNTQNKLEILTNTVNVTDITANNLKTDIDNLKTINNAQQAKITALEAKIYNSESDSEGVTLSLGKDDPLANM